MIPLHNTRGNTLSEYAFVGAIVLGIGVLAFMALGGSISNLFGNTNQAAQVDIVPGLLSSTVSSGAPGTTGSNGLKPTPAPDRSNAQGMATLTLTLSDGSKMTLDYPVNPAKSVNTIGSNGTTELLANTLLKLAQKLLDEGKITEDDFAQFKKMSNSGHDMAMSQASLLQSAQYIKITQPTPEQLAAQQQQQPWATDPTGQAPSMEPELIAAKTYFQEDYKALKNSGALQDPVVAAIVNNLYSNSISIQDNVIAVYKDKGYTGFEMKDVAQLTHRNSVGICNVGGGKDTGVYCP